MDNFTNNHWLKQYWRPMIGWIYAALIVFDFILAPVMMVTYAWITATPIVMWHPLSLEGGGLVHLALGSIVTATSWSRGNEKLKALEMKATTVS